MQKEPSGMVDFMRQMGDKLPFSAKFVDRDEQLLKVLLRAFGGADHLPTLPMTLWLGPARTVRQAMVGTIRDRVGEVIDSTDRLLRSLHYLQNEYKKPLPKDEEIDVFTRQGPCSCPCICN
jgi:hypothetical protein